MLVHSEEEYQARGPSVFMLSTEERTANRISEVMEQVYGCASIDFKIYVTKINDEGVKVIA